MNNQLQINLIKGKIGSLMTMAGFKYLHESRSEFKTTEKDFSFIKNALVSNNINIPITNLDLKYYITSFDNWKIILDTLYPILQEFKWTYETGDCDNRANFITTTSGIVFDVNTCMEVYCHVSDATTGSPIDYHKANMIVDDAGMVYLFDADNGGLRQKITSATPIMGNWKYKLISIRAY